MLSSDVESNQMFFTQKTRPTFRMLKESLDDVAILHLTHFTHTCCVVSQPPPIGIARGEGVAFAIQHSLDKIINVLGADFLRGKGVHQLNFTERF